MRVKVAALRAGQRRGAPGDLLDDALAIACGEGAFGCCECSARASADDGGDFLRGFAAAAGTRLA